MKHGCSRTGRRSLKSPVLGNIFPYNQTLNNLILHILVATLFTTTSISVNASPCQAAQSLCPTSCFVFALAFPSHHPLFLYVLVSVSCLTYSYSVSLFYLYPIILPSCWLADLNPVLFWSSALGETNSLWLSAATHILSCPSALTVCMNKRQREGGGGEAKEGKRERWRGGGGQVQREAFA